MNKKDFIKICNNISKTKYELILIIIMLIVLIYFILSFFTGFILGSAIYQEQCYNELRIRDIRDGLLNNDSEKYYMINSTHYIIQYEKPKTIIAQFPEYLS